MKLKQLILQGFKSFRDRTTVHFDKGVTGIVGPNGCGKSNIVDALFWVMGEQSAKHLRGDSMKDLIFAGSSKYTPSSFAEATLVLENTEGKHIHIGHRVVAPSELSLTRKLYRNGETEYRINGDPCRLRDIQEVFMDTGAGAKSYSIVAQGEIDRLVQARPEERKAMIEEVAGVTKFKMRKKESLRKIGQTKTNLSRLSDLKQEIEKHLKSLKRQSEKAEKAKVLKKKVEDNELTVNAHRVFNALKGYRKRGSLIAEKKLEVSGFKIERENLELGLKNERLLKDQKTAEIEKQQSDYNQNSRELAAAEERINGLVKNREEKESQIEIRLQESKEFHFELENRRKHLEKLEEEKGLLKNEGGDESDFCALEEKVQDLKKRLDNEVGKAARLDKHLEFLKNEKSVIQQKVFKNESRQEDTKLNLKELGREVSFLEERNKELIEEVRIRNEEANLNIEQEETLQSQEQSFQDIVLKSERMLEDVQEKWKQNLKQLAHIESTLLSLKELNASFEGAGKGVQKLLQDLNKDEYPLLGHLIKCEDRYARGVQALLTEWSEMPLYNPNEDTSNMLKKWLTDNPDERIHFFGHYGGVWESQKEEKALDLEVLPLKNVLELSEKYDEQLASFLDGFFLIEKLDMEIFETLPQTFNFKALATFDGTLIIKNVGGAKTFCRLTKKEDTQGIIERNGRIEKLENHLMAIQQESLSLEERVQEAKNQMTLKRQEHDTIRQKLDAIHTKRVSQDVLLSSKKELLQDHADRLVLLNDKKTKMLLFQKEVIKEQEHLVQKAQELNIQINEAQEKVIKVKGDQVPLQSAYEEEKQQFLARQLKAKTLDERLDFIDSQIEDIKKQIQREQNRLTNTHQLIKNRQQEVVSLTGRIKDLTGDNQEMVAELKNKEKNLRFLKNDLEQLLDGMEKRESRVKKLAKLIHNVEKEIIEHQSKQERDVADEAQITRDIFERYRIDLRDVVGAYLGYQNEDYLGLTNLESIYTVETKEERSRPIVKTEYQFIPCKEDKLKHCETELKSGREGLYLLGEINWQALEDYERQKARYDFLQEQNVELEQSLADLENAINHIEGKSQERFRTAFKEVNERFEKVFPIVFGGGNARLILKGDASDDDCGIEIIAQPPGKKMQNINLMSGGEKALTAVVLIFSIFLVKPSPFCLLDEVDAPLDDANVGRFNEVLREMSENSQFIIVTHNKKTMELNDRLYGVTMQEPGISQAVSVQLH